MYFLYQKNNVKERFDENAFFFGKRTQKNFLIHFFEYEK